MKKTNRDHIVCIPGCPKLHAEGSTRTVQVQDPVQAHVQKTLVYIILCPVTGLMLPAFSIHLICLSEIKYMLKRQWDMP